MKSKYLFYGKLTAKLGYREELLSILLEASKMVSSAKGCQLYVLGKEENDLNSIYITEIWDSKSDHDDSLNIEEVRNLIKKAMPILEKQPEKSKEIEILGGVGIE